MIYLALFLGLLAYWIYTECRRKLAVRVGICVASLFFIVLASYYAGRMIPHYESTYHQESLRLCEQALTNGNPQLVIQSLHAYNSIAATGSTYQAAMGMRRLLTFQQKP
jgi:hypothetical protein